MLPNHDRRSARRSTQVLGSMCNRRFIAMCASPSAVLLLMILTANVAYPDPVVDRRQEMRETYQHATSHYLLLDQIAHRDALLDTTTVYSHYYDPEAGRLYSCIGEGSYGICSGPERATRFTWSESELRHAEENDLAPINRIVHGPVYLFESATPMSQHTTYVYYQGENRVEKCRATFTTYSFEYVRNGEHTYFDSDRPDELVRRCETLYPREGK